MDVELAELLRRAYGPGADIAADPAAQRRLRALEAGEGEAPADPPEQGAIPTDASSAPAPLDDAPTPQETGEGARAPASTGPFWRRNLPWAITIAAVTLALAAGAALVAAEISRPRAELTLTSRLLPSDAIVPGISTTTLNTWGIPPGALSYHGQVGALDVWTMTNGSDAACLLLSTDGSFYKQSCSRRPLEPQIDVLADPDLIPPGSIDPAVPPGSTVRIALVDAVVEVFIARPPADTGT